MRLYIREYIFLYICKFGLQKLPDLQYRAAKLGGSTPTPGGKNVSRMLKKASGGGWLFP
ncbi:MAG: hypothetical protein U0361_04495 [Nitrospiraceae bacterium]